MSEKRRTIPKDWYKSREAVCLFVVLGLLALALLIGLVWLIVCHLRTALIVAGGLTAAAAAGYGIYRIADGIRWKRDLKRFDKAAEALKKMEGEK